MAREAKPKMQDFLLQKSIFCIVGSFWRKNQNETFLLILNYCQRKDRKFLVVIISLMAEK